MASMYYIFYGSDPALNGEEGEGAQQETVGQSISPIRNHENLPTPTI